MTSATHLLPTSVGNSTDTCPLPRKHRVWIALYALELGMQERADILAANAVTETDLAEFEEDWLRLRSKQFGLVA